MFLWRLPSLRVRCGVVLYELDVGIVFRSDTDLLPAIELAYHKTSAHIQIAYWSPVKPIWFPEMLRQKPPTRAPYCRFLVQGDFESCKEASAPTSVTQPTYSGVPV